MSVGTQRRPLVIVGGQRQQLPAADYLDVVQAADVTATNNTSTTLVTATGSAMTCDAGRAYRFEYEGILVATAATTLGVAVAYTGTNGGSFGLISFNALGPTTITLGVASTIVLGGAGTTIFRIVGRLRATTAGSLQLQIQRSGVATISITGISGNSIRV